MAHRGSCTAAQHDEHTSCVRIADGETGKPFYVSAVFRADADGEECFDLRITDLKHAWAAVGLRRPASSMYRAEWLEVAREALTGVPDATLRTSKGSYRWAITEQGGSMKLGWMFDMWRKDKEGRDKLQTLKGHLEVPAADDTAAIIERLVSQLVINAQTYKDAYMQLREQAEGFQQETQKAQELLKKVADEREQRDQQLFIKFAAVLNESKKKCREWQAKAQQAEEQLENGDATENESTPTPPTERSSDDEGAGIADDAVSQPAASGKDVQMKDADGDTLSTPAADAEIAEAKEPTTADPVPEVLAPRRRAAAKKRRAPLPKLRPEDTLGQTDLASQQ